MSYRSNPLIEGVVTPPIAQAHGWVRQRAAPNGLPLLDVSQAVPSYPPAAELLTHLAELIVTDPKTGLYTDILGIAELRRALAAHLSDDYGGSLDHRQVAITAGCNQAFCVAMDALARPGEEIILPLPYYFNHQMWLDMRGIRARHVAFEETHHPRVADFETLVNERTRAIVLVSPNNPSGTEYPPELFDALYDLAREREIALVVDETYKDFRARPAAPHRLFTHRDWDRTFVQLFSFSKAYALTGYRVGAMIAGPHLLAQAEKILDCLAICPSHIGQRAALYGLTQLADWRTDKVRLMRSRMAALRSAFCSNRLRYELVASGAYFAYLRHPFAEESATSVARRLVAQQNILCLPGSMFGPGQEHYLRFAFANLDADKIPELVERLISSQCPGDPGEAA